MADHRRSRRSRTKKRWSVKTMIPNLSPARWVWLAVLTAGTLALAYQSMAFSIAMITRRTNPDVALRFVPNDPVALATKADQQLLLSQSPKSLEKVERWAKESIRQQPLNPTAIRILGYVADVRGQKDKARELVTLAAKQSRREFGAQLWLIEDAAAKGQVAKALYHYDISLRATADSRTILFPTLTDALALPNVRKAFVPYVKQWPNWMGSFIGGAIGSIENPADIADVLIRAKKMPQTEENKSLPDALLGQLVAKGKFRTYRQYYLSLPGARASSLTSADMNSNTVNLRYASAGWQLNDNPAIGGRFLKSGNAFTLQAFSGSGERGEVTRKVLFLPPGQYRFKAQYSAQETSSDAEIRWDLQCLAANGESNIWFQTAKVLKGNSASAKAFTIPTGCLAQRLVLQLAGGSSQTGVELTLRSVSIQKAFSAN